MMTLLASMLFSRAEGSSARPYKIEGAKHTPVEGRVSQKEGSFDERRRGKKKKPKFVAVIMFFSLCASTLEAS